MTKRWDTFIASVFFVLGFSVVFSAVGVLLQSVLTYSPYVIQLWLGRAGGIVIILFGLYVLGLLNFNFLQKEHKFRVLHKFSSVYAASFVFGAAFAVGWTPCVSAALGAILTLAAVQPGSAFFLLFAYTLGLGIPFLVVGLFAQQAQGWITRVGPRLRYVQYVFGVILVVIYFLDKEDKKIEVNTSAEFSHELVGIAGYINTENYGGDTFQLQDYIGKKVILVDFWTYTCINCQRTLPYIKSWHEKYSNKGLLIVGVHTPEFEFEKKIENVKNAVQEFGIQYPVVQDNDYATWRAYKNNYWPHKYLIDINGDIVYDHVGEGNYAETEMKIQELLEGRMKLLGDEEDIDVVLTSGGDVSVAQSPETYFCAWRNSNLGNGVPGVIGGQHFEIGRA